MGALVVTLAAFTLWHSTSKSRHLSAALERSGYPELPKSARDISVKKAGEWLLYTYDLRFTCDPTEASAWMSAKGIPAPGRAGTVIKEVCYSDPRATGEAGCRFTVSEK